MSDKNLRNIELFFDYDLKIKNIMLNMAFKDEVNKDSLYAKEMFEVNINNLLIELTNLMINVPTDKDMLEYE